ncbi:MAG: MBL fold metallo-hydrolase [Spirochaetes bacterium]|nr:MBL fold metallo-hydrolase [Spirochaetota bacterium]
MSIPKIFRIKLGVSCVYLIRERGTILVDAGPPRQEQKFVNKARAAGIDPEEISLVVVTHAHMDHIGSLAGIRTITNAPVLAHAGEKTIIEQALTEIPKGVTPWGRVMRFAISLSEKNIRFEPAPVDIAVEPHNPNDCYPLNRFGIDGKIVHTPGHTKGSISLLLESGDAFVGDLLMNGFPMRRGPGIPIFADDLETVKNSVRVLLSQGAVLFFPGHGNPFAASDLTGIC